MRADPSPSRRVGRTGAAGPAGTARRISKRLRRITRQGLEAGLAIEHRRRWEADVDGFVYLENLGVAGEGRIWHHPSDWFPTLLALRRLGLGPHDVIADIGAGKGAALLVAAELPVRRVIGVELAAELALVARENVTRNRARMRAADVEVVTADAVVWPIPEDLTVVYLYSPIFGGVFERFVERLVAANDRAPHPLRLVYNFPIEHNRLMASGRVRVLDVSPSEWPPRRKWWLRSEVIVTYGLGDGPLPPLRGRTRPAYVLRHWSGPNDVSFTFERPGHAAIRSDAPA